MPCARSGPLTVAWSCAISFSSGDLRSSPSTWSSAADLSSGDITFSAWPAFPLDLARRVHRSPAASAQTFASVPGLPGRGTAGRLLSARNRHQIATPVGNFPESDLHERHDHRRWRTSDLQV